MESQVDSKSTSNGESGPSPPEEHPPHGKAVLKPRLSLGTIKEEKSEGIDTASEDRTVPSGTPSKQPESPETKEVSQSQTQATPQKNDQLTVKSLADQKEASPNSLIEYEFSTPSQTKPEVTRSNTSSPDIFFDAEESGGVCKFTKKSSAVVEVVEKEHAAVAERKSQAMPDPKGETVKPKPSQNEDPSKVEKEKTKSEMVCTEKPEAVTETEQKTVSDASKGNGNKKPEDEKVSVEKTGGDQESPNGTNPNSKLDQEKSEQTSSNEVTDAPERRDSMNSGRGRRRTSTNERNGRGRRRSFNNDREDSHKGEDDVDAGGQKHHGAYNQRKRTYSNEKNSPRTPRYRTKSKGNGQEHAHTPPGNGKDAPNEGNADANTHMADDTVSPVMDKERRTSTPIPTDDTEMASSPGTDKGNGNKQASNDGKMPSFSTQHNKIPGVDTEKTSTSINDSGRASTLSKDSGKDTPSPMNDSEQDAPSPIKDSGRDTPSPIQDSGRDTPSPIKDTGRDTPSPIKDTGRDTPPMKDVGKDTILSKGPEKETTSPINDVKDATSPSKHERNAAFSTTDSERDTASPKTDSGRDTPSPNTDTEREVSNSSGPQDKPNGFSPRQHFRRNARGSPMRYQRFNRRSWPQRERTNTNERKYTPQPNKSGHAEQLSSPPKENVEDEKPKIDLVEKEEKQLVAEANTEEHSSQPLPAKEASASSTESSAPGQGQQPQQQRPGGGRSYRQRRRSSTNERKAQQQRADTSGESAPKDQSSSIASKASESSVTLESDISGNDASKAEETSVDKSTAEKASPNAQASDAGEKRANRRRRNSSTNETRDRSNTNEKRNRRRYNGKSWSNKKAGKSDESKNEEAATGEETPQQKNEDKDTQQHEEQPSKPESVKDGEKPKKKRRNSKKKAEKKEEGTVLGDSGNSEYGFVHRPPNPILLQVARNYGLTRRFVYPEQSKILVAGRGYFFCFNYEMNKCCSQWISNCTWAIINLKSMSVQKRYKQGCQKCSAMVTPRFEQDAFVEMCHTVTKMYLSSILRGYIYKPRRKRLINDSAHFKDMCERCKEINEPCVQDVARQI